MKLLMENWRSYLNELKQLDEEFYFTSDEERANPLARKIVNLILKNLPSSGGAQSSELLQASGAEGIVLSLDDYRVIKMFHSIDNAAKNLPLVSKDVPETAQVYSVGKILLDQPVIYFKKGSTYTPTEAEATKEIFYIVMQRVKPDPYVYNYVELAYESFNRISYINLDKLVLLHNIEDEEIKSRTNEVFSKFMATLGEEYQAKYPNIETFLSTATRKQKNVITNQFSQFRKPKTKEFVFGADGRPVELKQLLLNYLGIMSTVPYAENLVNFLLNSEQFQKRPKKSFTSNTLREDLLDIMNLIKTLRIDKNIPWNDIHREQFGRNKKNDLIALDLGVKGDANTKAAASQFNKNVNKISTRGEQFKLLENKQKSSGVKVLNVFDFDGTLFDTPDADTGKKDYERAFKTQYPHKGWFGKEESLSDELDIPPIKSTNQFYRKLSQRPDSLTIVISDRAFFLKDRLSQFLSDRGYKFDDILLKKGNIGKGERLQDFWENHQDVQEINVFDDMESALDQYINLKDLYSIYRDDLQFNIYRVSNGAVRKIK